MKTTKLALLALTTVLPLLPLLAQAAPEASTPPAPATSSDDTQALNTAERNYVLSILANSLDTLASNHTNPTAPDAPDAILHAVQRELSTTDVPLDALSPEQQSFLKHERAIQLSALKSMKGKSEEEQKTIFLTMQQSMQDHQQSASPKVKRLFGSETPFQDIVVESQIDNKMQEILSKVTHPLTPAQSADIATKLRALAQEIRAMRQ